MCVLVCQAAKRNSLNKIEVWNKFMSDRCWYCCCFRKTNSEISCRHSTSHQMQLPSFRVHFSHHLHYSFLIKNSFFFISTPNNTNPYFAVSRLNSNLQQQWLIGTEFSWLFISDYFEFCTKKRKQQPVLITSKRNYPFSLHIQIHFKQKKTTNIH